MIDKKTRIIFCFVGILLVVVFAFFGLKNYRESATIKEQEEYKMELLEQLDNICLLYRQDDPNAADWPKVEIAPDVEIFHEELALYAHCFRLAGKTGSIATKEDIAKLYEAYDEELEEKFQNLYRWYRRANGKSFCMYYDVAISVAYRLYSQQYGPFNGKTSYMKEMLAVDKIALEQFVRDTPDFMPKEVYYDELYYMRIISYEESDAFEKAAREAQKQNDEAEHTEEATPSE